MKSSVSEVQNLVSSQGEPSARDRSRSPSIRRRPTWSSTPTRRRIGEVVTNLLSNAAKFSGPGGRITVSTETKGDDALVTVKDNGTGISSDILPNLFSKFATNSSSGTGLGLFISKRVVEAHGGKMWARNNDTEPGSTFFFTLPLNPRGRGPVASTS